MLKGREPGNKATFCACLAQKESGASTGDLQAVVRLSAFLSGGVVWGRHGGTWETV